MPLNVTRATKLMYLIEWEYFAWERKNITSLDWIYLHYGPWSSQLSTILQESFKAPPEEESLEQFKRVFWLPSEFNTIDTRLPFDLEGMVQRVFETFGSMKTQDIIRYIYFNTEPMQHATRRQPLDFTVTRKPLRPYSPVEDIDKNVVKDLREKLKTAVQKKLAEEEKYLGTMPPEFVQMLSHLDFPGRFSLPLGEVQIDDIDKLRIAKEG